MMIPEINRAEFLSQERGVTLGTEVGYSIRFEEMSGVSTRIKYMTEGVLVREMMRDPLLSRYSVVMLDEAHERTVFFDVAVGLLHKIQRRRDDLRIIISSATMDADQFKDYFNLNKTADPMQDTAFIMTIQVSSSDDDDARMIVNVAFRGGVIQWRYSTWRPLHQTTCAQQSTPFSPFTLRSPKVTF